MYNIEEFSKKHDKVICIDSDGTVIDAMNVKHIRCHGASFIEEWKLEAHAAECQAIWNDINLYEATRGINRFLALVEMLERLDGGLLNVDRTQLEQFKRWVSAGDLSNASLVRQIGQGGSELMEKALRWSKNLNERIEQLCPEDKPPFPGAAEGLNYAHGRVDIVIISSSNMSAIVKEWDTYGLLRYVDAITSQEIGSKSECIARLINNRYDAKNVLMIGDAYPDVDASRANGVWYYPICTGHETESWLDFRQFYFDAFLRGEYQHCQNELMNKFRDNFSRRDK